MPTQARAYVPLREIRWRPLLLACFGLWICYFFYHYLDYVAHNEPVLWIRPLIEEGSGVVGGILLFPLIYWVTTRFPLISRSWWRYLPIHLATMCLVSFLDTTFMAATRNIVYRILGLGHYDYGYMPVRYLMEFSDQIVVYWTVVGAIYLFHELRFARQRDVREAKLETQLAEARLENLRLQIEPHFLFNSLNAISAALYESPRVADEMIGRLSQLLRQVLYTEGPHQVPLRREIELAWLYTQMMEARFEDRLKVRMEIDARAEDALVPQLMLQPLIENAIRHGMDSRTFEVDVTVSARILGDRLELTVRDHGPGLQEDAKSTSGIGLRNTRERLEQMFGRESTLHIENAPGGGAMVRIEMPYAYDSCIAGG